MLSPALIVSLFPGSCRCGGSSGRRARDALLPRRVRIVWSSSIPSDATNGTPRRRSVWLAACAQALHKIAVNKV